MTSQPNPIFPDTVSPHGGHLVLQMIRGNKRHELLDQAAKMLQINLSSINLSDLELIATGAMSPLTGFMGQVDYERVITEMRLENGLVWTIPVTLAVDDETAVSITPPQDIALCENGRVLAIMTVTEKYAVDKEKEAQLVYKTTDINHPGVARLFQQEHTYLGGDIAVLNLPHATRTDFPQLRHTPIQTRRMFARRGWRRIVGFQTRTPIHRAHEYIQKTALEIVDGLFLHPLIGETLQDDIPAEVRVASYETILRDYYPPESVLLGVFPGTMRYAGPREAVFHAIIRKNFGCTHFIVGHDHAGFGDYYGLYDAQRIFDNFTREEIGIEILPFDYTFYCKQCGMVVSAKTCPHDQNNWVYLSSTQVREMLKRGEMLPPEFTRPEVSRLLIEGMRAQKGKSHNSTSVG